MVMDTTIKYMNNVICKVLHSPLTDRRWIGMLLSTCIITITLSLPFPGYAKESFEFTDTELLGAGWTQSQIDEMRSARSIEVKKRKTDRLMRARESDLVRREYQKWVSRGKTPCRLLVEAAYNRNLLAVREIAEYYRVDVNCVDRKAGSALWSALIRRGSSDSNLDVVKYLVDHGANVKYRREGESVSYFAGYKGKSESAAYIVASGGNRADAERGLRQANINAAIFLKGLELGVKGVKKTAEFVGESIREGAKYNAEERARLGVTTQLGVYKIDNDGDYTYIHCNHAPSVPYKMLRGDDGQCIEPPSLTGGHDCNEVLETLIKRCG